MISSLTINTPFPSVLFNHKNLSKSRYDEDEDEDAEAVQIWKQLKTLINKTKEWNPKQEIKETLCSNTNKQDNETMNQCDYELKTGRKLSQLTKSPGKQNQHNVKIQLCHCCYLIT